MTVISLEDFAEIEKGHTYEVIEVIDQQIYRICEDCFLARHFTEIKSKRETNEETHQICQSELQVSS